MDDLKELKSKVERLDKAENKEESVKILQEIAAELITDYEIQVKEIKIEPLWVEAYYYNSEKFADCNIHMNEKQKNHFNQIYFHKKGYGGFDICLSDSPKYYLSFLIKASLINGEFTTQTGIYDILNVLGINTCDLENERNILKQTPSKTYSIMYAQRVGLTKSCYQNEPLAAFPIEVLSKKEYNFKFARKSLQTTVNQIMEQFMLDNPNATKEECKIKCREIFGWLPDSARSLIEELK